MKTLIHWSLGWFTAVAGAWMFESSGPQTVTMSTGTVSFGPLTVKAPATARSVSGRLIAPASVDQGMLFAVHGGMVVNAMPIDGLLTGGTPTTYFLNDLPGGSSADPFPQGIYSIEAFAWSASTPTNVAISVPRTADLTRGDDSNVNVNLWQIGP